MTTDNNGEYRFRVTITCDTADDLTAFLGGGWVIGVDKPVVDDEDVAIHFRGHRWFNFDRGTPNVRVNVQAKLETVLK